MIQENYKSVTEISTVVWDHFPKTAKALVSPLVKTLHSTLGSLFIQEHHASAMNTT
jgi:hypothetical protein